MVSRLYSQGGALGCIIAAPLGRRKACCPVGAEKSYIISAPFAGKGFCVTHLPYSILSRTPWPGASQTYSPSKGVSAPEYGETCWRRLGAWRNWGEQGRDLARSLLTIMA